MAAAPAHQAGLRAGGAGQRRHPLVPWRPGTVSHCQLGWPPTAGCRPPAGWLDGAEAAWILRGPCRQLLTQTTRRAGARRCRWAHCQLWQVAWTRSGCAHAPWRVLLLTSAAHHFRRRGVRFSAGRRGRGRASPSPCSCPCPSPSAPRAAGRAASAAWGRAAPGRRSWPEGWTSARASGWPPGEGSGSGRLWLRRGAPRSPSSGLRRLPVPTSPRPATGTDSESGSPASARLEARAEPGGAAGGGSALRAGERPGGGCCRAPTHAASLLAARPGRRPRRPRRRSSRPRPRLAGGVASGVAVAATTPGRTPSRGPCPCLHPCRGGAGRGARGTGARRARRGWPESGPSG